MSIFQQQPVGANPFGFIPANFFYGGQSSGSFGILANLTPSPIPANDTLGGAPMVLYHVTVAPAGGAGTYTFAHGLHWAPTMVLLIAESAQGVTPTLTLNWEPADTTATSIAFNTSGNGTIDVYYG